MRRFLLLFLFAVPLSAQYARMEFQLQNAQGQAISGASVTVSVQSACGSPVAGLATLYPSSNGGTPVQQPLHTNGKGQAFAYAAPGCYTTVYNSPTTGTQSYPDQLVGGNGPQGPEGPQGPPGSGSIIASPQYTMMYQPTPGTVSAAQGDANFTTDGAGNGTSKTLKSSVNKVISVIAPPYNAKCDFLSSTTSITINASGVISGFTFQAADNGKQLIAYANKTSAAFGLLAWGTLSVSGGVGTISPPPTGSVTSINWRYATDDHAGIQQAFTDALACQSTYGCKVEFPAGSCLTSTVAHTGQSFFGHGGWISNLYGLPGKDVLAGPDTAINYPQGVRIEHIQMVVDGSVDVSQNACGKYTCVVAGTTTYAHPSGHTFTIFPNRVTGTAGGTTPLDAAHGGPPAPGPVIFGPGGGTGSCSATVASGSTTLTLTCGQFNNIPGTILQGMPVTVTGAGTAGGDLVTTAVSPPISNTQITLAAPSQIDSATAAGTYGTGFQPPWYIGNCASAYPQTDQSISIKGINKWVWQDVVFASNHFGADTDNRECGLFLQTQPYDLTLRDSVFFGPWGGYIEALPALHYTSQLWTPDGSVQDSMNYQGCYLPFVRYNGTARQDSIVSVYSGNLPFGLGQFWFNGPGNSATGHISYYYHEGWSLNSGEQERFDANALSIAEGKNDVTSYPPPNDLYVNILGNNNIIEYPFGESVHVGGTGNRVINTNSVPAYITDTGGDNDIRWTSVAGGSRRFSYNRGRPASNIFDGAFLLSGSSSTPYTSATDLGATCTEWNFATASAFGSPGCTSVISGVRGATYTDPGNIVATYSHMLAATHTDWCVGACATYGTMGPKEFTVGDRLPAVAGVIAVVIARCDAACTQTVTVRNERTNASLRSASLSFGTSWTVQTLGPIDLSAATSVLGDGIKISAAAVAGGGVTYQDIQFVGFEPPDTDTLASAATAASAAITTALVPYAPLASPTFTGTPAAPTAGGGTNTTQIATTQFVQSAVSGAAGVVLTEWVSTGIKTASAPVDLNSIRMYSFTLPGTLTATKISFIPAVGDNSGNLYDIGIYNSTGTLLCHTGATAGTTFAPASGATVTLTFLSTGCALTGGARLYLGYTGNATTLTFNHGGNALMGLAGTHPTANNTTAGGALNASVTPAADTWSNAGTGFPMISLHN